MRIATRSATTHHDGVVFSAPGCGRRPIADLYDPEAMPADLRAAHERNDEMPLTACAAVCIGFALEKSDRDFFRFRP
jgi:hypothetical protein